MGGAVAARLESARPTLTAVWSRRRWWQRVGTSDRTNPICCSTGDLVFDNILRADREAWLAIVSVRPDRRAGVRRIELLTNRWSELAAQADLRVAVCAPIGRVRRLAQRWTGARTALGSTHV